MSESFIDQSNFRRILNRNVAVPLGFGFLSAFFFSAIVYYLLSVSQWVERSVQGVAYAHEAQKMLNDIESKMPGRKDIMIRALGNAAGRLIVTPGVRPAGAALGDQKRVATPHQAMTDGADHIVVGRPIWQAADPAAAARAIVAELAGI